MIEVLLDFHNKKRGDLISPHDSDYSLWLNWCSGNHKAQGGQLICKELTEIVVEAKESKPIKINKKGSKR